MLTYFYIIFRYAKIIFMLSLGYVGCLFFLPIYHGLSIKLQVQKVKYFFRYHYLSVVYKMKCSTKIVLKLFLVV